MPKFVELCVGECDGERGMSRMWMMGRLGKVICLQLCGDTALV